jgi:hypothetical protein
LALAASSLAGVLGRNSAGRRATAVKASAHEKVWP